MLFEEQLILVIFGDFLFQLWEWAHLVIFVKKEMSVAGFSCVSFVKKLCCTAAGVYVVVQFYSWFIFYFLLIVIITTIIITLANRPRKYSKDAAQQVRTESIKSCCWQPLCGPCMTLEHSQQPAPISCMSVFAEGGKPEYA